MNNRYFPLTLLLACIILASSLHAQNECDLGGFVTFTDTEWAADANGNNAGTIRDIYFLQAFPQGLKVGGAFIIKLSSSKATANFLRSNGTPDKLTRSYTDPLQTESGLLGIHMVALTLNVTMDGLSPIAKPLKFLDLIITQGKFQGKKVGEFITLANAALGGADISQLGYTYSEISDAAARINENFANGSADKGFLSCIYNAPAAKASLGGRIWNDENNNGTREAGEPGLPAVKIELHNCTDLLIRETASDSEGRYSFTEVPKGSYYLKIVPPQGFNIGNLNQGPDDSFDSDFKSNGQTDCLEFEASADISSIDAALIKNIGADLEVIASVSKNPVRCGESFSFLLTVTNKSALAASEIEVTDILPSGTSFLSSTTENGSFDPAAGKWNVGSLDAGQCAALTINVSVNCTDLNPGSEGLGAAEGFNVFVFENMNQPFSIAQGKVAVGGDAGFSSCSVGELITENNSDALIVGGNLNFSSGSVKNGNVVYGGTTNLPQSGVSITGGTLRHDHPLNFDEAETSLCNLSVTFAGMQANGTSQYQWSGLTLKGSDSKLNIFNVSGSDFSSANYLILNVPENSAVMVNIGGQNVSWGGGMSLTGSAADKIMFNFYQARTLKIQGVDIKGSVLAPLADVDLQSGIINGQILVKSISGSGQFNNILWKAEIPGISSSQESGSFTNTASLTKSTPADSSPENNASSVTVYTGILNGLIGDKTLPASFNLLQNYPNPFNPSTTITFSVPADGRYVIKVFNLLGQEVATLLNREIPAGYHKAVFNASKIPSGIYIYRLQGGSVHLIRKMVLAK